MLLLCKCSHQLINVLSLQIKSVGLRTFTNIIRWFMAFTQGKWSTSVINLHWTRFLKFILTLIFNSLTSCIILWFFYFMYPSLLFLFPLIIFISSSLRPLSFPPPLTHIFLYVLPSVKRVRVVNLHPLFTKKHSH